MYRHYFLHNRDTTFTFGYLKKWRPSSAPQNADKDDENLDILFIFQLDPNKHTGTIMSMTPIRLEHEHRQRQTTLHCKSVSHWLSPWPE